MQTNRITLFTVLLILLALFSCEKEIHLNSELAEPFVVVNSILSPDSIVHVKISKSAYILNDDDAIQMVENATVIMHINGKEVEQLHYLGIGSYESSIRPGINDLVSLAITVPGINKTITCQTSLMSKIQIVSLDTTSTILKRGKEHKRLYKFILKFQDNSISRNYYRLIAYVAGNDIYPDYTTFNFNDIVFGNSKLELRENKYGIFTNDLFQGKEYTLTFTREFPYLQSDNFKNQPDYAQDVCINLQRIDSNYYMYLKTYSVTTDGIFSEPVQIFSNINNGIGIFGCIVDNEHTIKIHL